MIENLIAVLAPVFLTAAVGYIWVKAGRTLDSDQFTPIVVFIGSPCLVFSALIKSDISLMEVSQFAGMAVLVHFAAFVLGFIALKLMRLPLPPFLPALMLPNTGNMGLSLCLFAYGDVGLALGVGFFTVSSVIQFTIGSSIAAGNISWKRVATTPHIYAILLAGLLLGTETQLPLWLDNTISLIGQFTIPIMLLLLGVSLARLTVGNLGRAIILSVIRIGGGLIIGLAMVWGFDLHGVQAGVMLIMCTMPVAVFNYLFAQYYNNSPAEVAGLVVVSTVMSFVALPVLLYFIL
jgi:malate permease and related proteins